MANVIIIGSQWGDEGKGKVVDLYAEFADIVVRFQGGNNAGHTLVINDEKTILHIIPSGVMHKNTTCVVGSGVVIDPAVLAEEITYITSRGLMNTEKKLLISNRAHVIMPYHISLDKVTEARRAEGKIGTTCRGIGPAYADRAWRIGLRVIDLLNIEKYRNEIKQKVAEINPMLEQYLVPPLEYGQIIEDYKGYAKVIEPFVTDTERFLNKAIASKKKIMFEGAQGTMLDINYGTYPFVTSSSTIAGGACAGAGVSPVHINFVVGIVKAYTTRVGAGPFPTELEDETGQRLRDRGHEFGATTGRPRRCGWLDLVGLKYAVEVNGFTGIALTKLDVLSGLSEIKVCRAYELDGKELDYPPATIEEWNRIKPIYELLPGFEGEISDLRTLEDLPLNAKKYISYIESNIHAQIILVSVGPARSQTILLQNPFIKMVS
ncbi:MAG: adenylosuccinate synthase [Phycisphaerae bacterium]|nr:adenylosuccinate synthase [Phycisphaerae bacterium]